MSKEVKCAPDCQAMDEVALPAPGMAEVYWDEAKNDPELAASMDSAADLFMNDAFGAARHAQLPKEGITKCLKPEDAGFWLMKELDYLKDHWGRPPEEKPSLGLDRCRATGFKQDLISTLAGLGYVTAASFMVAACVMIVGDACINGSEYRPSLMRGSRPHLRVGWSEWSFSAAADASSAELCRFSACVMIIGDACITFFGATVKRWQLPGAPHAGQLLLSVCPRIASS